MPYLTEGFYMCVLSQLKVLKEGSYLCYMYILSRLKVLKEGSFLLHAHALSTKC